MNKLPEFITRAVEPLQKIKSFQYFDYFMHSGRYFDSMHLAEGFSLVYAHKRTDLELTVDSKSEQLNLTKGDLLIFPLIYSIVGVPDLPVFQMSISGHFLVFSEGEETYWCECHPTSINRQHLLNLFSEFQQSYKKNDEISHFRTKCLLNLLIADLLDMADGHRNASFESGKSRESFNKLIFYIINNYFIPFDAKQIAESLGLSVQYLNFLANEFRKMSLKELVNFYRLEQSREKLVNEGLSISEVAQSCGFAGAAYYIKLFRQTYGLTPLQCRKKLLKIESKNNPAYHKVLKFKEIAPLTEMPDFTTDGEVKVTMVTANTSNKTVVLSWLESPEQESEMYRLHPGQRAHLGTGSGECWSVREDSGALVAFYLVPEVCCQILV